MRLWWLMMVTTGLLVSAYIVATCPEWTSSPQKILCVDACDLMTIKDAEETLKEKTRQP
jgi:hypothetical protein